MNARPLFLPLLLAACGSATAAANGGVLYTNDFERVPPGPPPAEFLVLEGDFQIKNAGTNRFLELPGAPLDNFGVVFGPTLTTNLAVNARIRAVAKGRRAPTFGVGLGGVSGHRLQVSPAKNQLELFRDKDLKASAPFDWTSGKC